MASAASAIIDRAFAVAKHVVSTRYPGAACAFVAGSIIRGEGTISSDIDLVVVFDRLDTAWRESFVAGGFPVEAFVNDPETLAWFIARDVDNGHPITASMVADGHTIGADTARAEALKSYATRILAEGPQLTDARRDALRYTVTDLLNDLRGGPSGAEMRAIAATLYQPLADLILLGRGVWSGKGKWIPRLLERQDRDLARRFDEGFRRLAEGESTAVLAFAEEELARHGGALFDGDRRRAPPEARRSVTENS